LPRNRDHRPGCIRAMSRQAYKMILKKHTERLFEAFFTTKTEGMGMGLSISRSIIEAHAGRLWATPNAESGATFQFTVPMSPEIEA
jgi:signal transduction histidine kinase